MFGDDIVRALWKHRDKRKEMVVGSNPTTGAKNKIASKAILFLAPELKREQTFTIVLPNLIHKSKKRNLT